MRIIQTADLTPQSISRLDAFDRESVYNGLDCCVTLEVLQALLPQLDDTTSTIYNFSRELQAPILEMTARGLLVDQHARAKALKEYRRLIALISEQLDRIISEGIGLPINWRSPSQLCHLFYNVMELPVKRKRNAQGRFTPTANREAIEKLSQYFYAEPICAHLLLLRELDKKRQFLETKIDADGRIRANFNIAGTNTGRLASSMSEFGTGTNLQNVDRLLRSIFVADPGMKFANLDLEQGDARNVGAVCWNLFAESHGEDFAGSYLNACESGDLHTSVSRLIWPDIPWTGKLADDKKLAEQIFYRQDSYRQMSKKGGHGTNYYGKARTMAQHLHVSLSVIEQFQRQYFAAFPCIGSFDRNPREKNWHNSVRDALKETSSITTLLDRRRFFFGRYNDDETLRAAIAYEPQSLTGDEINKGMLKLWRSNRIQLLVQVHDSILFQYPEEEEAEIIPWALEALKTHIPLKLGRDFYVPTEAKIGWNWGDFDANENPDGLVKWKGQDARTRQERQKLSIHGL